MKLNRFIESSAPQRLSFDSGKVAKGVESESLQNAPSIVDDFELPPLNYTGLSLRMSGREFVTTCGVEGIPRGARVTMGDFNYGNKNASVTYGGKCYEFPKQYLDLPRTSSRLQQYTGTPLSSQRSQLAQNVSEMAPSFQAYEKLMVQNFQVNSYDAAIEKATAAYAASSNRKFKGEVNQTQVGNIVKSLLFQESRIGMRATDNIGQQTASKGESQIAHLLVFDESLATKQGLTRDFFNPAQIHFLAKTAVRAKKISDAELSSWAKELQEKGDWPDLAGRRQNVFPESMKTKGLTAKECMALCCVLGMTPPTSFSGLHQENGTPTETEKKAIKGNAVGIAVVWENTLDRKGLNNDDVQVRRTLAWIDAKMGRTQQSWDAAVRDYNGSHLKETYVENVMARVNSGQPIIVGKDLM